MQSDIKAPVTVQLKTLITSRSAGKNDGINICGKGYQLFLGKKMMEW